MHNGQLQQTNANNAVDALEILCEPVVFGLLGHFFLILTHKKVPGGGLDI